MQQKYTPPSLYAMLDRILDQVETMLNKPSSQKRNQTLNRAYGAIQSIADVQMDQSRWQRLNRLRSKIFDEWKGGSDSNHDNYSNHDGEPGDPSDYGDW